jgi:Ca2+/H+ antiporter
MSNPYLTLLDKLEKLFYDFHERFKTLEIYNMNDEFVIYSIIFIVTAIIMFTLYALKNFYQLKPNYELITDSFKTTSVNSSINKEENDNSNSKNK